MQRRNFIQITGACLGSLLINNWNFGQTPVHYILEMPVKVFVTLNDGFHKMISNDKLLWEFQDVIIRLVHGHTGI